MKWIEILKEGSYALLQDENNTQYVVARGYNREAPENNQWIYGTYFGYYENDKKAECLNDALEYYLRNRR